MNAAHRRADATNRIIQLCGEIIRRTNEGPNHHCPTDERDALQFERIVTALESARIEASKL